MSFIDELYKDPPKQPSREDIAFISYERDWVPVILQCIKSACLDNRKAKRLNAFLTFDDDCYSGKSARAHTESIEDYFWKHYCKWFHHGDNSKRTYDGMCSSERLINAQHAALFYSSTTGTKVPFFEPYILDRMIISIQNKLIAEGFSRECIKLKKIKYSYIWPSRMKGLWNCKLTDFVERTEHTIELYITW